MQVLPVMNCSNKENSFGCKAITAKADMEKLSRTAPDIAEGIENFVERMSGSKGNDVFVKLGISADKTIQPIELKAGEKTGIYSVDKLQIQDPDVLGSALKTLANRILH